MRILVTSAGGPAAVGVIKSLKDYWLKFNDEAGHHYIVATDMNEVSVGFHMANKGYVVPAADDSDFLPKIKEIIKREKIDLILPTSNMEIDQFEQLSNITNVFMSDSKTIKLCNDKWEFYNKVKDDFDIPYTWQDNDIKWNGCFARPRYELGGSRGTLHCKDIHQYMSTYNSDVEYIYSDYLPGQEYTIDVLCDMEKPLVSVVRKRLQTKAGISTQGEIIRDEHIESECKRLCEFLKLKGPVCIQMKEDKNGVPNFVEVNPRFGGGTYFTTLAGVNFVEIIICILEDKPLFINEPKPIKVIRYHEELVI